MAGILVYSEQDALAFELLAFARTLGVPVAAAVMGRATSDRADEYAAWGADRVLLVEDERLTGEAGDLCAQALAQGVGGTDATTVLISSTRRGKELAGRLAQRLECGAVTDAIGLTASADGLQVQRYGLGGNTVVTEVVVTGRQVIAVMPRTFEAVRQPAAGERTVLNLTLAEPRVRIVEQKNKPAATADLANADKLVVVGKGLGKNQDLALVMELAKVLGGEVGCTRALAADYHWLGEERMVGISGKKVKPRLLISVGVSGQIQHTVGVMGSQVIVAINKDKAAPVFKIADYGIVGDLYQVLPILTERLEARPGQGSGG